MLMKMMLKMIHDNGDDGYGVDVDVGKPQYRSPNR